MRSRLRNGLGDALVIKASRNAFACFVDLLMMPNLYRPDRFVEPNCKSFLPTQVQAAYLAPKGTNRHGPDSFAELQHMGACIENNSDSELICGKLVAEPNEVASIGGIN